MWGFATAVPGYAASEYSDAVQRKLGDMHDNLEQLEDLILDIERGLKQTGFSASAQGPVGTDNSANSAGDATVAALPMSERFPTNARCFSDIDQPMTHTQLMLHRDEITSVTTEAILQLEALEVLQKGQNSTACDGMPGILLESAETRIKDISRRDLVGLVFHLQSCWISENERSTGDTRIDPDAIYLDFAEQLRLFDDARRKIAHTKERCK